VARPVPKVTTARVPRPTRTPERSTRTARREGSDGVHLHVRRGDSLAKLLAAQGVGRGESAAWLEAFDSVHDLRLLQPRRGITLRFDRGSHALEAIHYEIDDHALVVVEKTTTGIRAQRTTLPYFTEVKGAAGIISRGLRSDAEQAGVPPTVVSELADIFGWELDLERDLHPDDEFRVLYENIWQTGAARAQAGRVLGAEVVTGGGPVTAIYFEDRDGRGAYYRPSGRPLSRGFLRYPVEFTEITSEFSPERLHPILGGVRPHLGVDLAAPHGTPVRAVASGTVQEAGWSGRLGRSVRLDHAGGIASTYGHLARVAPGIRPGAAVETGQVIGYVGATGLATGPHLHFAVERGGEYVDPLALAATDTAPALPDTSRRSFERVRTTVTQKLAGLPRTVEPLTVSLSDTAGATTE
jgi:murein DD-endopeptidase MepM/ murein hydrolase activator NlpD